MRRYQEADTPDDGVLAFTLHAFLRSLSRKVDGRTYEQLRGALGRLERTVLESDGAWHDAAGSGGHARFTLLSSVTIDRRRQTDFDQLALFPALASNEPGEARVIVAPQLRATLAAGRQTTIVVSRYLALSSPVARRLYRLLEAQAVAPGHPWEVPLDRLAERLPLSQRYPSHLQRVLQPAHEMLLAAGLAKRIEVAQVGRQWTVRYER